MRPRCHQPLSVFSNILVKTPGDGHIFHTTGDESKHYEHSIGAFQQLCSELTGFSQNFYKQSMKILMYHNPRYMLNFT